MDQSTLVGDQIDEGRRFVERFAADGNPVRAAFWGKAEEEDSWFLYVATETVDRVGPTATYRAAHSSLEKLRESWITGSEIKVISPSDPVAREVIALMARHSGPPATRLSSYRLGPTGIEYSYVYPSYLFTVSPVNPMTSEDVGQELIRLMNRSPATHQPSFVSLKNGISFNGVPFSIQLDSQKAAVVQFIEYGEASPRVVRLDEIASVS